MKTVIAMPLKKKIIRQVWIYFQIVLLATFILVIAQESYAEDDFDYIFEDFEGNFANKGSGRMIPAGWQIHTRNNEVRFSKGTEKHHGEACLNMYSEDLLSDGESYTYIETAFPLPPGTILNLQIQYKILQTGKPTTFRLASGGKRATINTYSGSNDWKSLSLKDIEVPSNGKLPISLMMGHHSSYGYSDVDIDCLTYEIVFAPVVDLDTKCISDKLKAVSVYCKSVINCGSKDLKKPDEAKLNAGLAKAEGKFASTWQKTEIKATKNGLSCYTDNVNTILGVLDNNFEDVYGEILNNVNTNTKGGAKLAASLLKAAGTYCGSIFKAESANAKKDDPRKLSGSLGKAEAKFLSSWGKAIAKAGKKGATYNGDIGTVTAIIEDMVDEVFDGLEL